MKKLISIISLLAVCAGVQAQNLVPNGDFEYFTTCPNAYQIDRCIGWRTYHAGSTDYFNGCSPNGVPNNSYTYQYAASGNAYMGLIGFQTPGSSSGVYVEYLATQITPMIPGLTYEVSMSLSLSNARNHAHNGMGVWFYDDGPTTMITGSSLLPVTPQAYFTSYGPITDTMNWVRVTTLMTADSAYDNIVIGRFDPPGGLVTQATTTSQQNYYLVDSVVIKALTNIVMNYSTTSLCAGNNINVPFSLPSPAFYTPGNIFSLQLSNTAGSFTTGTTILGTLAGNVAGTIAGTIPGGLPAGSYKLRVISTSRVDSSAPLDITVGGLAANRTISSNSPLCEGSTLTLTAGSSTPGINYLWTGHGGYSASGTSATRSNVSVSQSGYYVVKYQNSSCSVSDSVNVTVHPNPVATVASASTPVCETQTLNLNATNSNAGVSWSWTGPGGYAANIQNPVRVSVNASMAGDYIVTATNTNNCTTKDTVTVTVKPMPQNVNATSNSPVCLGTTLNLNAATASSGVSFSWVGPSGFSNGTQAPAISPVNATHGGDYIVTVTLNGCAVKDTVTVAITSLPSTPVAGANTPVCTGQDLKLTAGTIPGATYTWQGPAGFTSGTQNPVRTSAVAAMAGTYTVKAILNSCESLPSSILVNILPAPALGMYPTPKDSICTGGTASFISTATNAGASPVYKWYKNGIQIAGAANSSYSAGTVINLDEYYCTVTSNGTCFEPFTASSPAIKMHVLPYLSPAVSITATPNTPVLSGHMIIFNATSTNGGKAPKYQWKRNGKDVVGALSNTWGANTLSNKDTVCVVMTSNYQCPQPATANSNCIVVTVTGETGIDNTWATNPPTVYPNPTKEFLIVENIKAGVRLQLNDVLGRTIISQTATQDKETINTSSLAAGTYMLQLREGENRMTLKILKE